MNYAPPSEMPYISRKAPSLKDVAAGRSSKRKAQNIKMTSRKRLAKGTSSSAHPTDPAATATLLVAALQVKQLADKHSNS
jgi:hypothetical protein